MWEFGWIKVVALLIVGHAMERFVMDARADFSLSQLVYEFIPANWRRFFQDYHEKMPRVIFYWHMTKRKVQVGAVSKSFIVELDIFPPKFEKMICLFKLGKSYCGIDI